MGPSEAAVSARADRADRWIAVGLALYGLGIALWLLAAGARVTREDGFYYLKIAQNVAEGAGSTFDGVHVTNGYHPLWLLSLVPLFWISRGPGSALTLAVVLQGILMAAGACVLYRTLRLGAGRFASSLGALLWLAFTYREALSGLEFGLQALGVLSVAYVYRRWFCGEAPRLALWLALGLLLGLTFLARLDNLLLAALIAASLVWRDASSGLGREGARRLLALGLPIAFVATAYVVVSLWLCGRPFPVSGAVKRSWSLYLLAEDPRYQAGGLWLAKAHQLLWPLRNIPQRYPLYLSIGTFGAGALYLAGLRGLRPWGPFVLFSVLQLVAYAVLFHGEMSFVGSPWYFAIQPALTAGLVAAAAERLLRAVEGPALAARSALLWAVMVAGALSVPVWTVWSLTHWRERGGLAVTYDAAEWVRTHLPEDAVVGSWHAGAVGYLSGRRVVNLDGLVNSWEYFETHQRDLCRYWEESGVTHLVDMFDGTHAAVPEAMYKAYAPCVDRLEPLWSDDRLGGTWRVSAFRILHAPQRSGIGAP